MAELDNLNYLGLVSQAITDFDNIFKALQARGVKNASNKILTNEDMISGAYPTSSYANLITSQLYTLETGTGSSSSIKNFSGQTKALETAGVVYDAEGKAVFTGKIQAVGYYDETSEVTVELPTVKASLNGVAPAAGTGYSLENSDDTQYVITPGENYVLSEVAVDKGKVEINMTDTSLEHTITVTPTTSVVAGGTITNAELVQLSGTAKSSTDVYTYKLSTTSSYNATLTAKAQVALEKPGYVTELTTTKGSYTSELTAQEGNAVEYEIQIPKAAITDIKGSGTVAIVQDGSLETVTTGGYLITATPTVVVDTTNAQISSGYIAASDKITVDEKNITNTASEIRIKQGSLGSATNNAIDYSDNLDIDPVAKDGTAYKINVELAQKYTKEINAGYIDANNDIFEANITLNKDIELAAAALAANPSQEVTSEVDTIFSEGEGDYTVTVNIGEVSVTPIVTTEGYITEAGQVATSKIEAKTKTFSINAGSVSASPVLTATAKAGSEANDGPEASGSGESKVNLFVDLESIDTKRDYYEIDASAFATVSAGYVTSGTIPSSTSAKKYLQKAQLKYIDSEEFGKAVEVTKGGYLPAGLIAEVSEITGTIDKATAAVTIKMAEAASNGKYAITLDGNPQVTDAGYLDQAAVNAGAITLVDFSIAQATGTLNAALVGLDNIQAATPVYNGETNKYTVSFDLQAKSEFTLPNDGYITKGDITSKGGAALNEVNNVLTYTSAAQTGSITLAAATIKTSEDEKVDTVITANGIAEGDESSPYYVDANVKANSTINVEARTAGYLSSDMEAQAVSVVGNGDRVYIKAGTKLTNVAGSKDTAASNTSIDLNDTVYELTIPEYTVNVSGTLEEGYYKDDAAKVSGAATVKEASYSLGKAAVTVTSEVTNTISSEDVTLVDAKDKQTNVKYVTITATGTSDGTATLGTVGYLGTVDQVEVVDPANAVATIFIKEYNDGQAGEGVNTKNNVTVGGEADGENITSAELQTAGTYSKYNTVVTLHNDAMGAGVAYEVERLRARLSGLKA